MARLKVLVVEDDALIGMLLSLTLQELGYDVAPVVANQADAVRASGASPPDLMIVDEGLAGGSGVDTMAEILRGGFIPHVFVTGDVARIRIAAPHAVVIQKPFMEAELLGAMQLALDRAPPRDCLASL
jgi:DNA-binding response OmpR family regulator